jgi:hypothetical protein
MVVALMETANPVLLETAGKILTFSNTFWTIHGRANEESGLSDDEYGRNEEDGGDEEEEEEEEEDDDDAMDEDGVHSRQRQRRRNPRQRRAQKSRKFVVRHLISLPLVQDRMCASWTHLTDSSSA